MKNVNSDCSFVMLHSFHLILLNESEKISVNHFNLCLNLRLFLQSGKKKKLSCK